eukprot:gene9803-biopygen10007
MADQASSEGGPDKTPPARERPVETREPKTGMEALLAQQAEMMTMMMQQMKDLNARVEVAEEAAAKAVSQAGETAQSGDAELEALKRLPYVYYWTRGILPAPALSYMHDAIVYSEVTLDWLQDEKEPPTVEDLAERVYTAHNTLKGVFALLSYRYTMIQLRELVALADEAVILRRCRGRDAGGQAHSATELAAGCKVKVYWPADDAWYTGTVGDSGLTHIVYEDGDEENLEMSMTAKQTANSDFMEDRELEALATEVVIMPRRRDVLTPRRPGGSELPGALQVGCKHVQHPLLPVSYSVSEEGKRAATCTTMPGVPAGTQIEVYWEDDDAFYPGGKSPFLLWKEESREQVKTRRRLVIPRAIAYNFGVLGAASALDAAHIQLLAASVGEPYTTSGSTGLSKPSGLSRARPQKHYSGKNTSKGAAICEAIGPPLETVCDVGGWAQLSSAIPVHRYIDLTAGADEHMWGYFAG